MKRFTLVLVAGVSLLLLAGCCSNNGAPVNEDTRTMVEKTSCARGFCAPR